VVTLCCGQLTYSGIAAILFDKDGTLANVEAYLMELGRHRLQLLAARFPEAYEPLCNIFNLNLDHLKPEGLLAVASRRDCEVAAAAIVAASGYSWVFALEAVQTSFRDADQAYPSKATQTPVFEGIVKLLQGLRAASLKIGILSADTLDNVQDFVEYYQLQAEVQLWMGVESGPSKPDPNLFWQACTALQVEPHATLMVGDAETDMLMGHAAGAVGCIGASWGWRLPPRLATADVHLTSPQDIQILQ
jgi:phosphoglycolate phosphatase